MDEETKILLEKNLKMTEEMYVIVKKINRTLIWQQIFSFLKILIIIVPIVLGMIYLPPLLKDVFNQYQSIMGLGEKAADINNLPGNASQFIDKNLLENLKK